VTLQQTYVVTVRPCRLYGVAGSQEYCAGSSFRAACYQPDEVVTITRAHYGLMAHGRCFDIQSPGAGCYADVIGHVAGACSGRRSCELEVNSLRADNCQADFPFYLNASFTCVKGMTLLCSCNRCGCQVIKLSIPPNNEMHPRRLCSLTG